MEAGKSLDTIREVVGVFHSVHDMEEAIDELTFSGFDHAQISLLASEDSVENKLGHRFASVNELEDDPDSPRIAYVPTETVGAGEGAIIGALVYVGAIAGVTAIVASGGALATAIVAAAAGGGTGGIVGGVLAKILEKHHADYLHNQLRKGGLILWVRTWDKDDEEKALSILTKYSGDDVHVHDIAI